MPADPNTHRFSADSVDRAVSLLSDRWNFLIMREAFFGVRRFGQMARNLRVARTVLIKRLDALVDAGLFERVAYNDAGTWHEYRLTEMGLDLYGSIVALMAWGDRHLAGPQGPPLLLHHRPCDHDFRPEVVCSHCRQELRAADVEPRPGPGASQP